MAFSNDAVLWYDVGDWKPLGLAVPNFGNDRLTLNGIVLDFVHTMGRSLQAVMFGTDARLSVPPSIGTLVDIHKLCLAARSHLSSRAIPFNQKGIKPSHSLPAPEEFRVFPAPYFHVRNRWLKRYSGFVLLAITEAVQHQENARPLEISDYFSGLIGQYLHRLYRDMSVDLFRVPVDEARALDFTLSQEQLLSYDPAKWFTETEMIDTVPDIHSIPTEDDLKPLTDGIPVSQLPSLYPWPNAAFQLPSEDDRKEKSTPKSDSFSQPPGSLNS